MILYWKAFHIISMVAWFAALFYLPRLFVYHADAHDVISQERFKIMERRLYFAIGWPAAILTTWFGLLMLSYNATYYLHAPWMHAKLTLVALLWVYHVLCGYYVKQFAKNKNKKTTTFYRVFNEVPTLFLISIVLLVVVKPLS